MDKLKTVCNECGNKTICQNDPDLGFLCESCEIKLDKRARIRMKRISWMNSNGAIILLGIAAFSLVTSMVFSILQYFKST